MVTIFKGDVGTIIEITVKDETGAAVDLSGATLKQIKLKSPTGTVTTKTATFSTNGSDGKIRYTTVNNDLSPAGEWTLQGYIEIGSNIKFHTSTASFVVLEFLA